VHHLLDPRTRRPARTDLVQATVLTHSARTAEVLAKAAVILGRDLGLAFLEEAGALAAVVLTDAGDVLATPPSLAWLEAA
jgi:thiamine biosynthesis lipoprotein